MPPDGKLPTDEGPRVRVAVAASAATGKFSSVCGKTAKKEKTEYEKIYSVCCMAEVAADAGTKAKLCREALDEIIKFLYQKENKKYPENATMLELIDGVFISGFVNNNII